MVQTAFRGAAEQPAAYAEAVRTLAVSDATSDVPSIIHNDELGGRIVFEGGISAEEQETQELIIATESGVEAGEKWLELESPSQPLNGSNGAVAELLAASSPEAFDISTVTLSDLQEEVIRTTGGLMRPTESDLEDSDEPSPSPDLAAEPALPNSETGECDPQSPLAGWDYSKEPWPVPVGPAQQKSFSRLRALMVVFTLVLCAVAFFYLVYQPSTRGSSASAKSAPSAGEGVAPKTVAANQAPEKVAGDQGSASPSPASAAIQSAGQTQPAAANDSLSSSDARGGYSLQAAAFPSQAGAEEFAGKLRAAGIASYVVSADMGKRGTWHRVRIGRFESAEAAKQYSTEAQRRAKAGSGIALQLIVCQIEQQ